MPATRTLLRTSAVLALAIASAAAAGCGDDDGDTISRAEVEREAAAELAAITGQDEPNISCPDDLAEEVGATTECELTVEGDDTAYPVFVEVTSVEGGTVSFSVEVGEAPTE
jgi:hypothetical protein